MKQQPIITSMADPPTKEDNAVRKLKLGGKYGILPEVVKAAYYHIVIFFSELCWL